MANAIEKADKPAITIGRSSTVMDAVRTMVQHRIGAVVIVEKDRRITMRHVRELDPLDKVY